MSLGKFETSTLNPLSFPFCAVKPPNIEKECLSFFNE